VLGEEQLRELVTTVYDVPPSGLLADLLGAALDRVNWEEIVASHLED